MKRLIGVVLCAALLCTLLTGCGTSGFSLLGQLVNEKATDYDSANDDSSVNSVGNAAPTGNPDPTVSTKPNGGLFGANTVAASYGKQLARSRNQLFPYSVYDTVPENEGDEDDGFTYPLVFEEPLRLCTGFTLEYEIMEVIRDDLSGNYLFEVLVRNMDGKWKSAGTFQMDGYKTTVQIELPERMGIKAVAVTCGKHGDLIYSFEMQVRDPICE